MSLELSDGGSRDLGFGLVGGPGGHFGGAGSRGLVVFRAHLGLSKLKFKAHLGLSKLVFRAHFGLSQSRGTLSGVPARLYEGNPSVSCSIYSALVLLSRTCVPCG